MIKAVIVDDIEIERFHMKLLAKQCPDLEIVGDCGTVDEAARIINRLMPDIVFLDIDLGGATGFDVLSRLDAQPHIIFTTVYDRYAVQAFQVNALDYLMKPITLEQLAASLTRVHQARPIPMIDQQLDQHGYCLLKNSQTHVLVAVKDMAYIQANADYSSVTLKDHRVFCLRRSMKKWNTMLPTNLFGMLDRSTIINKTYLREVNEESENESCTITMENGDHLNISKRGLRAAIRMLNELDMS